MRSLLLLAVIGCSFPEKHRAAGDGGGGSDTSVPDGTGGGDGPTMPDAGGPFACLGLPFPTNAPPQITFSGVVQTDSGSLFVQPSAQGITNMTAQQFFGTNTDATGHFTATVPTNGVAIDGHLLFDAPPSFGYAPLFFYPRHPFDADQLNQMYTLDSQTTLQQLYSSVGRNYNSNQATVFLELTDCNGTPIAGATLMMQPMPQGGIFYLRNGVPDTAANMTDANGTVVALGANPTTTQISGRNAMAQPLHTYAIPLTPGALYEVVVQP